MQVADMLSETLQTDDVAVILEARHLCVEMRGVRDSGAETSTMLSVSYTHLTLPTNREV